MRCCLCTDIYDLDCANVAEKIFINMPNDQKITWKCHACRSKQPKFGNVDTPISVHSYVLDETQPSFLELNQAQNSMVGSADIDNVTVRRPPTKRLEWENSFAEDTYCLDNIRGIIRQELEHVIEDRLASLFRKFDEDQVVTLNSLRKVLNEVNDKVDTLERTMMFVGSHGPREQTIANTANTKKINRSRQKNAKSAIKSKKSPPVVGEISHVEAGTIQSLANIIPVTPVMNNEGDQIAPNTSDATSDAADEKIENYSHDKDGWTEVKKKRLRNSYSRITRGTASPSASQLEASEQRRYLHLYYVKAGTTAAEVLTHLNRICGEGLCTVDTLKARGNYASFKLGVSSKVYDVVMSSHNWAENICVKPWQQFFRTRRDQVKKP